jgi:hypothetical protein
MISNKLRMRSAALLAAIVLPAMLAVPAGYKARPWAPRSIDSYPARLVSEGITIAVEPLFNDALAAQVFDKTDIVAGGIMPLAVIIFNSNDFPIEVDGRSIELLKDEARIRSVDPVSAVQAIYASKPGKNIPIQNPIPLPKITGDKSHADACRDFTQKYFSPARRVEARSTGAGFLYLPVKKGENLGRSLAEGRIYIPNLYRADSGKNLLFFEIELKPAIDAATGK